MLLLLGQQCNCTTDDASRTICQPGAFCRVALFNLEEYESAKAAFEAGQALDTKNSTFKTWIRKCAAELDGAHSLLPAQAPSHDWFALILLLKVRYPIQCKPVQQVSMNLQ